jgi:hypothetical protein
MGDLMKHLPYAPYIMYMIERVSNVRFPKDVINETFVIKPRSQPRKVLDMLDP